MRNFYRAVKNSVPMIGKVGSWFQFLKQTDRRPITLGPRIAGPSRGYLAMAVIAKNEGAYLREWLEFHRLVGVEHIFFYDNGSTDDSASILASFTSDFVTHIPWNRSRSDDFVPFADNSANLQRLAYAHALWTFGHQWRWIAFVDMDEFLFPTKEDDLRTVLQDYEDIPALATPWHVFIFSGHKTPPSGLVIESYLERAQFPPHKEQLFKWKSIVDPSKVRAVKGPHFFIFDDGEIAYDEQKALLVRGNKRVTGSSSMRLRLNHYFTKSEAEFEAKLRRGYDWLPGYYFGGLERKKKEFTRDLALEGTVRDETILRFLPRLKSGMASGSGRSSLERCTTASSQRLAASS